MKGHVRSTPVEWTPRAHRLATVVLVAVFVVALLLNPWSA